MASGRARGIVVCLCHDVTLEDLERCAAAGYRHPETIKRATGAMMGPCQGKHCAAQLMSWISQHLDPPGQPHRPAARPPLYPVRLGSLAGGGSTGAAHAPGITPAITDAG